MDPVTPRVLHYAFNFLPVTCGWIYPQVAGVETVESSVLCHTREHEKVFPLPRVRVVAQRPITRYRQRSLAGRIRYRRHMAEAVRALAPDLLHAHFGREGACLAPLARRLRLPLVTSFYGFDLALSQYRWWRRRYAGLFDYGRIFLCEGPHARRQLVSLGCPEARCRILRLGIDLAGLPYRERAPNSPRVRLLMASSFREKKGVALGIEAFARVARRHPGATLEIIGDGPLRPEVDAAVAASGCADRITLWGYQPHEVFTQRLYASDLFLAPSLTARDGDTEGGSPVSITEAGATGLPVVSSRHADIPAVVLHEQTGLLAEERDVAMLAAHIARLVEEPATRQRMGLAARQHIEAHFSREQELHELRGIYAEVLSSTRRSA